MSKKRTQEEFIIKVTILHNGKYSYEKVEYKDNNTKVIITCPIHGEFLQSPHQHLSGQGCPDCSGRKKGNTEIFIEKANLVHSYKYNYEKVVYKNNSTKVIIICLIHGEFLQTPKDHLYKKCGCPKCSGKGKTTEEIVRLSIEAHKEKYGYTKVVYKGMFNKIIIDCEKHGEFLQTPQNHILNKNGCPQCAKEKTVSENERSLREKIINFFPNLKIESNFRKLPEIRGLEIDIFLPEICLAIEWNGKYWHNFSYKRKNDKFKKEILKENLIQIIDEKGRNEKFVKQIFEEIVKPEIERRLNNLVINNTVKNVANQ
jgi:hypothetical protein